MAKKEVFAPEERAAALEQRRLRKMARSAHSFVRGNTKRFYEWLGEMPADMVPEGPPVWICGDCHLENLGAMAGSDGKIAVIIRDLDQAVIGNPAHDLIRLGLSLASAARGSDLPGVVTARIVEEMVQGYMQALAEVVHEPPATTPELIETTQRRAIDRSWKDLARDRLKHKKPRIEHGKKLWPLTDDEHDAIDFLFRRAEMRDLVLKLERRSAEDNVRLLDAAYWVKGCSSLEGLRYAVVVAITDADGDESYALFDLKEAVAPLPPVANGASMPDDPAQRVVTAACGLSPPLGQRMMAATLLDTSIIVRELLPQDQKIEVGQFRRDDEAIRVAGYLARVVGSAHAGLMSREASDEWRAEMRRWSTSEINAPSWLWRSIVNLAGRHETAYLDHCRDYALVHCRPS